MPNPQTGLPLSAADCQTTDASLQLVCGLNTLDGFSTLVAPISENSDTVGALEQGTIDGTSLDARTVGLVPLKSDAPAAERPSPRYPPCLNCLSSARREDDVLRICHEQCEGRQGKNSHCQSCIRAPSLPIGAGR